MRRKVTLLSIFQRVWCFHRHLHAHRVSGRDEAFDTLSVFLCPQCGYRRLLTWGAVLKAQVKHDLTTLHRHSF